MSAKNYDDVLGVSRRESPAGIRDAYRELAKRLHRDVTGTAYRFQEIDEAYEALSDPSRRSADDREWSEREWGEDRPGRSIPITYEVALEPIAPEPISLFRLPEQTQPSFEAFQERYARNFTGRHVPKAERPESLTLDVVLSPAQALAGCSVPVGVPVFRTCTGCGGAGHVWPFRCFKCDGSGLVEAIRELDIPVPPGTRPHCIVEAPLNMFGIGNLYLRIHISLSVEVSL
jgi:molecular chaperone DnaJ